MVQVGLTAMGFVDTLMAGHLSAHVLAAVAIGNLFFFTISHLATGTLMALDPLVSQALGAGDAQRAAAAVQRGLILSIGLALGVTALMLPARSLLVLLGQPTEIVTDAAAYLHVSIPGVLPFLVFVVLRQSLQAMHRVAAVVWVILATNALNAALNWVFLFGHAGSPPLGAIGSALATCIARWVMALGLLVIGWPSLRTMLVPLHREIRDAGALRHMLGIGVPIGLQQLLEAGAFGAVGLLMGRLGVTALAAHQVAISLAALTFMVPLGVGAAAAVRVGHAIGARDAGRVQAATRAAYICGVGFMCITAAAFLLVPGRLAALMTRDPAVVAVASLLIPIAGVFQVFDGGQAVGAGVLRGMGDTRAPLIAMLAGYWLIGIPLSALLAFRSGLGATGLWWGFVASLGAVAGYLASRIRSLSVDGDRSGGR